ncbi:hypothetical protein BGCPKDLD_4500 [Methylorubrum suomiense]|uniref:Uncharacterized protein n=1 Tax=Methylorubrum suomiense TaxID=144191 RepID=A0ABQ4V0E1_9HYPH|nr:hypothetical protein BGCPKDLD_4500 [Methylorubrum suomiense]
MVNDLDHTAPGDPALDIMFHNISYANAFGGRWGGDLMGAKSKSGAGLLSQNGVSL